MVVLTFHGSWRYISPPRLHLFQARFPYNLTSSGTVIQVVDHLHPAVVKVKVSCFPFRMGFDQLGTGVSRCKVKKVENCREDVTYVHWEAFFFNHKNANQLG